jgi:ribose transport system ATP-binding protein
MSAKVVRSISRRARLFLDRLMEFQELGILVPVLIFSLAVGIAHPVFFSAYNMMNVIRDISMYSIMAFAMTFVLVSGGIDLSVGSVLALSGVAAGLAAELGMPVYVIVSAGLLVGCLAGLINAILITRFGIPPVITTLGMFYFARGIVLVVTGGFSFVTFPPEFLVLGRGDVFGVPLTIIFMMALGALFHVLLSHTPYGYWISAIGGSRESARRAGLNIGLLGGSVYMLTGLAAGTVGILLTSRLSLAHPQAGLGWELQVIAGVIIGGASLFGGVGTILGTLLGSIMLGMLTNALIISGVSAFYQQIAVGVIIVSAVGIDSYRRRIQHVPATVVRTGRTSATLERPDLNRVMVGSGSRWQDSMAGLSGAGDPVVEMKGITKFFGYVHALDNVDFEVYPNEVVALVGDNGAGKSTLMKILSGAQAPDRGEIIVRGQKVRFHGPHDATELGMAMLYQDLALVDCRSVAANLFLGREPRRLRWLVDHGCMFRTTKQILDGLKVTIASPRVLAGTLSGGQRQVLAIGKCVSQGAGLFILDEPTSALGVEEASRVLTLIGELRNHGCSVIVISHNLLHVFSVADRIVVLRGGQRAGSWRKEDTNVDEVVSCITGADLIQAA